MKHDVRVPPVEKSQAPPLPVKTKLGAPLIGTHGRKFPFSPTQSQRLEKILFKVGKLEKVEQTYIGIEARSYFPDAHGGIRAN